MAPRAISPARSENEVDIGTSLFGGAGYDTDDSSALHDGKPAQATRNSNAVQDLDMFADELDEDDDDDDETAIARSLAASNRKATNLKGRTVKKGGGFQAMGLNAHLLKAITRKGFSVPTPIQRKTIPLLMNEKDVVGMARTGSGKTAAFVIPMIEKLKVHSQQVGTRALILSPSRELALQTMQVVRELGRGTDLRSILLVGGDSLEEQFSSMSNNPDIVIATPGRFLHLQVEMNLDLSSVRYVVFDEADRLFEMGFAAQLAEILHALPASRQTLLFSATLPKSLVEFARAGLQDPILVRLDADSKMSPDLQSAFFTVKSAEKEGALLHILQDIIHVPTSSQLVGSNDSTGTFKKGVKRKRSETENGHKEASNPYSTIVFAATKHHVEYLAYLLKLAGYSVSHVYGSLDQTARKLQVQAFRSGQTNILVVTDVAARGIDIPILANVINYDFPSQPKIYIHRVGRTARAGQKGWSYSIVHDADAPYLLDLQLFLGRKLTVGRARTTDVDFAQEVVVGSLQRDNMEASSEWVASNLESDIDLGALRSVAMKGGKLYQRTRNSASAESAKRSRGIVGSNAWTELHPLFNDESSNVELEREKMLARVSGFRPQESIFEIGARRGGRKGNEEAIGAMRSIRHGLEDKKQKSIAKTRRNGVHEELAESDGAQVDGSDDENLAVDVDMSEASDEELEVIFTGNRDLDTSNSSRSKSDRRKKNSLVADAFRDMENFMSYTPTGVNVAEDRAYGVHSGTNSNSARNQQSSSFVEAARGATMDLNGDESTNKAFGEARSVMRWDKRHKKYVSRANDEDGSKGGQPGKRLVRGESGAKIAASFRSGRYDAWKKANRIRRAPRVGEQERSNTGDTTAGPSPIHHGNGSNNGTTSRFQHKSTKAPKQPDKYRDDYEKQKKKFDLARQDHTNSNNNDNANGNEKDNNNQSRGRGGGAGGRSSKAKSDLKSVDDIRKARNLKQKRKDKNARPSRRGGKR